MKKISLFLLLVICFAFSACNKVEAPSFPPELFQAKPLSGSSDTLACDVYLDKIDVVVSSYDPSLYLLQLTGEFSNTCQDLQVFTTLPDADNIIQATFGATGMPRPQGETKRVTVELKPFYISVPLREVTKGKYKIVVNKEQSYDFELP